jgi:hypothetical protein
MDTDLYTSFEWQIDAGSLNFTGLQFHILYDDLFVSANCLVSLELAYTATDTATMSPDIYTYTTTMSPDV